MLNEICKDTMALFNEDKTPALKVLKVDLTKVNGTKCADCYGCPTHDVARITAMILGAGPDSTKKTKRGLS